MSNVRHTFRWLKPDVYPLIGAVSVGLTAGVVIMARKLSADPTVEWVRSQRGKDVTTERGQQYVDSWHRRMFAGRVVGILPDPIKRTLPDSLQEAAKDVKEADEHVKSS